MIRNEGTATTEHFERITLFADGGNEVYDDGVGDDVRLGNFVENPADPGRSFLIAGLDLPLDPPCGTFTRLYVSADIAQEYSVAGTIRFSIPVMGLRVVTGNDGPTDSPVVEPSIMLIPKPDRLTVFPYPVGDDVVNPGSTGNLNAGAGFYNGYDTPVTLTGIKFYQVGTASSAEIDSVFLHADTDADGLFDPANDARISAVAADGVAFAFDGIAVGLEPGKISYFFVTYDAPLAVTDASTVDLTLFGPADITIEPLGSLVEGDFPVNSPGTDTVDGMIAAQIGAGYVPPFNASPNYTDIPALTLVLPPNGIWADELDVISIENEGTALGGRDIAGVRLWREGGGDPERFDPGMEDPIDDLDWTGSSWTNSSPLNMSIPLAGLRLHATFTVTATPVDGVTVRARLPVGGVQVASANDGPIDAAIRSANQQTISTDPLVATLLTDRLSYSAGQEIALSLAARNEGPDTLYGVHPSIVTASGSGSAVLSSAPSPAVTDMAPGSATTFVWRYTADTAGDISFCARAYSGDSLAASQETCAETALIENRAAGITMALASLAPASANRGQDGVKLFRLDAAYASSDPLGAAVEMTEIRVGFKNGSGTPIAPNSVLSRIVFADPDGPDHVFSVADSTNPVLRLAITRAISMQPGAAVTLAASGDISNTAAFASFSVEFAAPGDIRIVDENDGTPVTKTSSSTFPWATTPLTVNAPAETLLVGSPSGADLTANVGQENIHIFTLDCSNPGDAASARVILTDLRLGCFDLASGALPPESVVRRLRITDGATVLYDNDVVSQPSGGISVALATPLVLSPGSARPIDFYVDLKSVTAAAGFYVALENPRSVTARDINTAELVLVGAADPASRDFPFSSDRVSFQNPASGIVAAFSDRLPAVLLPSTTGTAVMDVIVSHEGAADASSVRVDSLALEFSFADGSPALPGDYFGGIAVVHEGSTVGSRSFSGELLAARRVQVEQPGGRVAECAGNAFHPYRHEVLVLAGLREDRPRPAGSCRSRRERRHEDVRDRRRVPLRCRSGLARNSERSRGGARRVARSAEPRRDGNERRGIRSRSRERPVGGIHGGGDEERPDHDRRRKGIGDRSHKCRVGRPSRDTRQHGDRRRGRLFRGRLLAPRRSLHRRFRGARYALFLLRHRHGSRGQELPVRRRGLLVDAGCGRRRRDARPRRDDRRHRDIRSRRRGPTSLAAAPRRRTRTTRIRSRQGATRRRSPTISTKNRGSR